MTVESLITQHIDTWISAVKTQSTSGRGSSKKLELYGIKKLRELILELAVRGKLVPQDPNDDSVSVLLEQIAAKKAQLVKDKVIKNPKKLSEIVADEKPFDLPKGWEWIRLGNYAQIFSGNAFKSGDFSSELGIKSIKITNAGVGSLIETEEYLPKEFLDLYTQYRVKKDDLILALTRPYISEGLKISMCPESYHNSLLNQRVAAIRAYINPDFSFFILRSPYVLNTYKNRFNGNGLQPNLKMSDVTDLLIPICSEQEQHRIVAKVDELMALCDQLEQQTEASIEAHQLLVSTLLNTLTNSADADELMENWKRISNHFDTLFTTEASIDQLKQTILQLAVMGKLVPQDPNDEPASVLLERIAEEKTQLIKDKKIKKQKALPPIADDEKPFELPKGWEWIRLGALTSLVTSGSRGWNKYYSDSGATFIRSQDIKYDRVEFDNRAFVELPQSTEGKRTKVDLGDILVTITGANVGKAAVVEQELPEAYVSQHVSLIKLMDQRLSPYIHLWLTGSHGGRLHLLSQSYGDKPGLNLQNINELVVPVAPEEHQLLVLTKVDQLMELCERLKQRLCDSQQTQLKLTDAIVEQAL